LIIYLPLLGVFLSSLKPTLVGFTGFGYFFEAQRVKYRDILDVVLGHYDKSYGFQGQGETIAMKITLLKDAKTHGATLVAFATSSKSGKTEVVKINHSTLQKRLMAAIEDKTISGKPQTATVFRDIGFEDYRHVVVLGLGPKPTHEGVRRAAAEMKKALSAAKCTEAIVHFDGFSSSKKEAPHFLQAFVEGALLAAYDFDELKTKKDESKKSADKKDLHVHIVSKMAADTAFKKAFHEGSVLAKTVNFSRRLGDLPGNLMTPTILARTVVEECKGAGIKVTVWDKARIKKEKMGGLLGVSMGSDQEPRFIIMEYKGTAASKKAVAFVGKGLTFDSGGISLKPGGGMEEMKYDMCGGANMIGTLLAIARLKLKINAVAIIPASENMPGPSATKPGDVHIARNGISYEINNTDAEGRLILSDALCYASELKPQVIVDAATLTGAMVVALSNIHTGYFTRSSALKNKIEKAAEISGELIWNMPLTDEHLKDIKGTYADLSNISSSKGAGSATAAAFLEQFVEKEIPWAHFDIAGTGWAVGNRLPWCSGKGASGVMIRTLVELAKQYI
jgi:leucyl aminopeptidase